MALLHFLESEHRDYFITHVNYHHRPTASRDEDIVRRFASEHGRDLYILHSGELSGNFQAAARKARYDFFVTLCKANGADTIAIGHNQDDSIETWMMQIERQALCSRYGLAEKSDYEGLILWRPLLGFSKAQIQAGMDERNLEYGIDESNLSDDYRRNRIRHELIEPASLEQRETWLAQMQEDNARLQKLHEKTENVIQNGLSFSELKDDPDGYVLLDGLLVKNGAPHSSRKALEELIDQLESGRMKTIGNQRLQVVEDRILVRKADENHVPFFILDRSQLDALCKIKYRYDGFCLSDTGRRIESFSIDESDFPLFIRQIEQGDRIEMREGNRRLHRLLISRQIPAIEREDYRVIEGRNGILFADGAGCDLHHYVERPLFFMVKLPA